MKILEAERTLEMNRSSILAGRSERLEMEMEEDLGFERTKTRRVSERTNERGRAREEKRTRIENETHLLLPTVTCPKSNTDGVTLILVEHTDAAQGRIFLLL